ncbi:uncharacterized protein [Physcomitrium patens]|uniref:uncharacterized protein isoform X1 n=1 Tax=Physcomitrium patens TaxID=3218 RepID=UPI003CCD1301
MKGFQGLATPIQVVKMASLRIPTAIAQTNILRHMHKTCTDCSLTSLDQHGIGFAAPSPNLSAIGVRNFICHCWLTPRGRLPIVRAGGCPFGFKNTTGKGSNRESSMETNVTATASSPVDSPYAPSPSADAPDEVNLGPGTFEYLPLTVPLRMTMGTEPLNMKD